MPAGVRSQSVQAADRVLPLSLALRQQARELQQKSAQAVSAQQHSTTRWHDHSTPRVEQHAPGLMPVGRRTDQTEHRSKPYAQQRDAFWQGKDRVSTGKPTRANCLTRRRFQPVIFLWL